jgi:hypothetical protein
VSHPETAHIQNSPLGLGLACSRGRWPIGVVRAVCLLLDCKSCKSPFRRSYFEVLQPSLLRYVLTPVVAEFHRPKGRVPLFWAPVAIGDLSSMRGRDAIVGTPNVETRSEIVRVISVKVASEGECLASYDDFMITTVHCSCRANGLIPG